MFSFLNDLPFVCWLILGALCLGVGLTLIYACFFWGKAKNPGEAPPLNWWGIIGNVVGGMLLFGAAVILMPIIFSTSTHAELRRTYKVDEGQYTVADRVRTAQVVRRNKEDLRPYLKWEKPVSGNPLWYAINVFTTESAKPNTDTVPGDILEYGPLPENWTEVEIFYGTSMGPSLQHKIRNSAFKPETPPGEAEKK